jgi:hypothetical protein
MQPSCHAEAPAVPLNSGVRQQSGFTVYFVCMSKIEAIEKQIQELSEDDLAVFRKWFAEFDAKLWDRQLERDVQGGKLDALAEEALQEHKLGKTTKL